MYFVQRMKKKEKERNKDILEKPGNKKKKDKKETLVMQWKR